MHACDSEEWCVVALLRLLQPVCTLRDMPVRTSTATPSCNRVLRVHLSISSHLLSSEVITPSTAALALLPRGLISGSDQAKRTTPNSGGSSAMHDCWV